MLFISLLFIQILIFVCLALVLRHFLTSHVTDATAHLQKLSLDYAQKLDEVKKQKEEAEKYYKDTLLRSSLEGEKLKQQLIEEAHRVKKEMLDQAHQQVEEIVKRAQTAADLIVKEKNQNIQALTLEKMHQLISELMPGAMSEQTHARWVDGLIHNGFDRLNNLNVSDQIKEVKAVTAFPLKPKEKSELENQLSRKIGRTIHLKEEIDPKLILGVRLAIDSLVIDGSLQFRIQEWLRHAQSENSDS